MRLGEAMVKEAVINNEQLARALERQIIFGGRLGTNLVEIGAISEEDLAKFLSKVLGVPYAPPEAFKSVSAEVIKAFPRELAEKYTAFPLKAEGKRLHLAMKDPNDVGTVDDLGFILGQVIKPFIASEIRILYALEKHYGIKRDLRYVSLLDEERVGAGGSLAASAYESAPPPSVPPKPAAIPAAPQAGPGHKHPAGQPPETSPETLVEKDDPGHDYERPAASASTLVESWEVGAKSSAAAEETKAPPAPQAPATPERPPVHTPAASGPQGAGEMAPRTAAGIYQSMSVPEDREHVAGLIVSGAALAAKRAVLFLVKGNVVTGWRAHGDGLADESVKGLSLSLEGPSVLKEAVEQKGMYKGPVLAVPQNEHLLKSLGGARPQEAVCVPLIIKDKVVGVLYADDGDGAIIKGGVEDIRGLMARAFMSLEILILKNKILGGF